MNENKKCLKSSHSADFWGGGNFLSSRNEGLENGTAKPCHPEERSDVGIALSFKDWLTNKRKGLIASSPYSPIALKTKTAFTLAEVLITLGIIGIVAAMTLPAMIANVQERILNEQARNTKYKITQATDKMKSLGLLGGYSSTEEFLKEFTKHYKVAKICSNQNLKECWAADNIETLANKNVNPATLTTGNTIAAIPLFTKSTETMGVISADGVSMILLYGSNCSDFEQSKSYMWSTVDNKPETNATTNCLSVIFDVNGAGRPNKIGKDVRTLNSLFGAKKFPPSYVRAKDCNSKLKSLLGMKDCYAGNDYWAGALKTCHDNGLRVASAQTLANMAGSSFGVSDFGPNNNFIIGKDDGNDNRNENSSLVEKPDFQGCFATPQEVDANYAIRTCSFYSYAGAGAVSRGYSLWAALCTGD